MPPGFLPVAAFWCLLFFAVGRRDFILTFLVWLPRFLRKREDESFGRMPVWPMFAVACAVFPKTFVIMSLRAVLRRLVFSQAIHIFFS